MSKQTKPSSVPTFIETHWTDHPAVEWMISNKQTLLWIIIGVFAILILSYRVLMSKTMNAESDFLRAQTNFTQFQEAAATAKNALGDSAAFSELENLMKRHPELHGKYDGPLAQTLLIEEQIPQAETYAQATFRRTAQDSIGHFHEYATTSLLIGAGKFQEALLQAQQLKEKMQGEARKSIEDTLYLFNLIRLALLNQQLGMAQEEKQLWEEVQNTSSQLNAMEVINLFQVGNATLNQYIDKRKKNLGI